MKCRPLIVTLLATLTLAPRAAAGQPAVTVYNQNFGVVRERITLDVEPGVNRLSVTDISAHVEPDSVILRDPTGRHHLQVLEQNYRNDPLSQALLLSLYEGQTIGFQLADKKVVTGRIVRSGFVPHRQAWQQYGQPYYQTQSSRMSGGAGQPIIELDGVLRFGLPGTPLFPSLADDTILEPTLHWLLETDAAGRLEAELSYVTGGMSWKADYNVVAPQQGDVLDLVGWVTIDNQCGKTFEDARVKLMAGDVSKIQPRNGVSGGRRSLQSLGYLSSGPPVTEQTFDEYHLYTLRQPTTLRDRETKQVEFVRAAGVQSRRLYIYDGARIEHWRYQGWDPYSLRTNREYGNQSNPKVWVMREFENTTDNSLGIPLPAGRLRFYRSDDDGQLKFTGENEIDHTPQDETVRVYTGSAFDLVGERRRTHFEVSNTQDWLDEAFEIKVRNHKDESIEVRIVEHLYRWRSWEIVEKSQDYLKTDSQTIDFRVQVPPNSEQTVTYKVHYTW